MRSHWCLSFSTLSYFPFSQCLFDAKVHKTCATSAAVGAVCGCRYTFAGRVFSASEKSCPQPLACVRKLLKRKIVIHTYILYMYNLPCCFYLILYLGWLSGRIPMPTDI